MQIWSSLNSTQTTKSVDLPGKGVCSSVDLSWTSSCVLSDKIRAVCSQTLSNNFSIGK